VVTDSAVWITYTASNKSEVKLLTLSKDDYEEVKDRFPEARDLLIGNVRDLVSLGKDGTTDDTIMVAGPRLL